AWGLSCGGRGSGEVVAGRTAGCAGSGEGVFLTVLTVTGGVTGGCAGSGEGIILTVGTGLGNRAGSRISSGGCGTWIGDSRLTTTVSLRRSGEVVALDHAAITWGGGRRPGCCGGMGGCLRGPQLDPPHPPLLSSTA